MAPDAHSLISASTCVGQLKALSSEVLLHGDIHSQLSRESDTIFGQGTMLEPSTPYIGKGVALVAQAATPVYPRVYRRPTISDSRNDHS